MKYHNLNRGNTNLLKNIIRHPFAMSYERAATTHDGELICSKCLKDNFRTILHSTKYLYRDGWQIIGSICEAEMEDCFCAHCNKSLGYITDTKPKSNTLYPWGGDYKG